MSNLIEAVSNGVPDALSEVITLGRTLKKRAADVLAYFDRLGTSNGPTEAINGRLNICAAPHSRSATSPTTSPDPCSRPEASDPNYTLDWDEPLMVKCSPPDDLAELRQRGAELSISSSSPRVLSMPSAGRAREGEGDRRWAK